MNKLKLVIAAVALMTLSAPSFAEDAKEEIQVVHCGLKDGKMKVYGTKSAAEADGATNIVIQTDGKCPELK